jgi:hypothetical protein
MSDITCTKTMTRLRRIRYKDIIDGIDQYMDIPIIARIVRMILLHEYVIWHSIVYDLDYDHGCLILRSMLSYFILLYRRPLEKWRIMTYDTNVEVRSDKYRVSYRHYKPPRIGLRRMATIDILINMYVKSMETRSSMSNPKEMMMRIFGYKRVEEISSLDYDPLDLLGKGVDHHSHHTKDFVRYLYDEKMMYLIRTTIGIMSWISPPIPRNRIYFPTDIDIVSSV